MKAAERKSCRGFENGLAKRSQFVVMWFGFSRLGETIRGVAASVARATVQIGPARRAILQNEANFVLCGLVSGGSV